MRTAVSKATKASNGDRIPISALEQFDELHLDDLMGETRGKRTFEVTADVYQKLIEHAPNPRFKAIYTILANTGMRKGELNHIQWKDVDLVNIPG